MSRGDDAAGAAWLNRGDDERTRARARARDERSTTARVDAAERSKNCLFVAQVNHAELLLEGPGKADAAPALYSYTERGPDGVEVTYGELRRRVAACQAGLAADGVKAGDRVAGVVANDAGAAVAMLAATSLGASWSSVSPDFGEKGCLDRLRQVAPKVLFVSDAYSYRGREFDIVKKVAGFGGLVDALPGVARCVVLPSWAAERRRSWLCSLFYEDVEKRNFASRAERLGSGAGTATARRRTSRARASCPARGGPWPSATTAPRPDRARGTTAAASTGRRTSCSPRARRARPSASSRARASR